MMHEFETAYRKQFSFLIPGRPLIAEAVSVEAVAAGESFEEKASERDGTAKAKPVETVSMFTGGQWRDALLYRREGLEPGERIEGPAIIAETNATTVVEQDGRGGVCLVYHISAVRANAGYWRSWGASRVAPP